MDKELKRILSKFGQYRDISYISPNGEVEETRCLVVPALKIEPLLRKYQWKF